MGEWTHIDCLRENARDEIHDDILRKLIFEPGTDKQSQGAPVKAKSRLESLLAAVDLETLSAQDGEAPRLTVRDVPGGTVSFLFEKSSKSVLVAEDDG